MREVWSKQLDLAGTLLAYSLYQLPLVHIERGDGVVTGRGKGGRVGVGEGRGGGGRERGDGCRFVMLGREKPEQKIVG
jgi:hypothetical protein